MSIYKELNKLTLELDGYEEVGLTAEQKKNWEERILKKIRKPKRVVNRKIAGTAAAFLVIIGATFGTGVVSLANVPFVGAVVEGFITANKETDYAPYKTEVGMTAENELGKWTLNEAMLDQEQLILSSTFEPAEGVKFNYGMHPMPHVIMEGQSLPGTGSQQSIKVNESMYTIYNKINIPDQPFGETLSLRIEFDNLDAGIFSERKIIQQPWIFDIKIPTAQLAAAAQTIELDKEVLLEHGHSVRLKKMVVTPISSLLYYDWPEEANHIGFKLQNESGTEIRWEDMTNSAEGSYVRFPSIDIEKEKYVLIPYEVSSNPHAVNPGIIEEQQIPIN